MSQITWKKRLVLLILFIGSFLVFNNYTGKVSGYNYSLVSVQINGKNALGNPNLLTQARLQSELIVNATWCLYYNPAIERCSVKFQLFNNKSLICNSTQYSDIGSNINHLWMIPLLPQNWSLVGGQEYGQILISFDLFDGLTAMTKSYVFPVLVLPEEINCTLSSTCLENDTSGRMKQLDLLYQVKSIQNPLCIHSGLGFSCNILNVNNDTIGTQDFFVNNNGFLNVTISTQYLIYLENNSFVLNSFASTKFLPVVITGRLSGLIHRSDIILYFQNITEITQGGYSSISLNFEANATQNNPELENNTLYFTWKLLNESSSMVDSGSIFTNLFRMFTITIKSIFITDLENLSLSLWFEGNFLFKEKSVELFLANLCSRENIDISLINIQELQRDGYGNLIFRLNCAQDSHYLSNHQIEFKLLNIVNNGTEIDIIKETDSEGCFNITLTQQILRDLESYEVVVRSIASLEFKENNTSFLLKNLFSRVQPEILMENTSTVSLFSGARNKLEFKLNASNFNENILDGTLISLSTLDETNHVIDQQYVHVDSNGLIDYILPVHYLVAGQDIFINISMNATFITKELAFIEKIQIQAINMENGHSPAQSYTISLSIFLPGTCILAILFVFKRHKKQFLSKKAFKISMK
ncbi:MAG TPA: hypothetical protein VKM55_03460 [Candidatus Lokiarchaeia archaeon]|nr:hypothetical protein [Candidatus Lokiarchaeia archaeon]